MYSLIISETMWYNSMENRIATHLKRHRPVAMTKKTLVIFKKISALPSDLFASLDASLELPKKGFFRLKHLRFSRKAKCLTVVAIIAVLLVSVFAFLPKQNVSKANVIPNANNFTATPTPLPSPPAKHSSGSSSSGGYITQWFHGLDPIPPQRGLPA